MLRDSSHAYGKITQCLHWLHALCVFGLFGLGYWMIDLTYYSSYYQTAPLIHRSVGVLLLLTLVLRWLWRRRQTSPKADDGVPAWQHRAAHWAHRGLYALVVLCCVSGYLISTADGRAIAVFNWFYLPALPVAVEYQEEIAGTVHYYSTYALVALACLHALAALKHHFIDRHDTLRRMLPRASTTHKE